MLSICSMNRMNDNNDLCVKSYPILDVPQLQNVLIDQERVVFIRLFS
jgi:hypothetical protein